MCIRAARNTVAGRASLAKPRNMKQKVSCEWGYGRLHNPMGKALYGWGSNLFGQLRQPLNETQICQPVRIANAEEILCVTATQVIWRDARGARALGYVGVVHDQDVLAPCDTAWTAPRSVLGHDHVCGWIDNEGFLCFNGQRIGCRVWRDAAMSTAGQVVAITGMYAETLL